MSDSDRKKLTIQAELDATGVREGANEAVTAAKGMAQGMKDAGREGAEGLKLPEKQSQQTAAAMSRAEKNMVGSIQRATVALQSGGKAGADYYEMLAKQRGISGDVLKPYVDQLRQAEAAQKALTKAQAASPYVMSDRAQAAAMRGVPAQFTDIVTSLQGGQNPLTVMLQQGGQLKDMFGGVGNAAKALGGYVLGLVNPFTLAAAAAGVASIAYYQGSKEADEYAKSIILTGNAAGVTTGQLAAMAVELDKRTGFTQGAAAGVLAELTATGRVAVENLSKVAEVALRLEQDAGIPVKNTVKDFEELGKAPVEASLKLTEQHRYLTTAVYEQIKALQDQGREADAARVAQEAYADALVDRTDQLQQRLGYLERAWRGIKTAAREAWDAMLDIGRPDTKQEHLAKLESQLASRMAQAGSVGEDAAWLTGNKKLQGQIAALKDAIKLEGDSAAKQGESNRVQLEGAKAVEAVTKANERALTKQEQKTKALKAYDAEIEKIRKANPDSGLLDPKLIAKTKAGIEDQYKEKTGGGRGGSTAPATRRLDLSEIQNAAKEEVRIIDGQQKDLERLRQSGLIDDQGYYEQKRGLIERSSEAEEKALQEQISRLQQEKVKGNDALAVKKQIADTETKLAAKRLETGEKLKALNHEETLALDRQRLTMEALAASHQRAMAQMREQQQRTVSSAWMGSKDRHRAESMWGIKDSYDAERRRLEDQRMFTPNLSVNQQAEIDQRIANLEVEKGERIRIAEATYAELDSLQARWDLGAGMATQNYVDQVANTAQQTADLFTNAFKGMEDALVNFAMTGKLDFKSLANSIISDIIRIQARAALSGMLGGGSSGGGGGLFGALVSGIGGMLGGGAATGAATGAGTMSSLQGLGVFAKGAAFENSASLSQFSNQIHDTPQFFAFAKGAGVFGEAGPEAIMPLTRAADGNLGVRAIQAASRSADAPSVINVQVNVESSGQASTSVSGGQDSAMNQLGKLVGNAVKEQIAREQRPGGLLWAARNGRA